MPDQVAYGYHGFGLDLLSNVQLPNIDPALGGAERLNVLLGSPPDFCDEPEGAPWSTSAFLGANGQPERIIFKVQEGKFYWIRYADGTDFVVDARGETVWARWAPDSSVADMATYLLNPVMAFLLQLRGYLCLHGSVIDWDGSAVCFLGSSGAGKSTTAALMGQLGCGVLSDDIVAITEDEDGHFWVHPGFPGLRLWSDSVEALYGSPDALPWVTPTWEKRFLDLRTRGFQFSSEAKPLAAIYVLGNRSAGPITIAPLEGQQALMALVANSWPFHASEHATLGAELRQFGRLAAKTPVRRAAAHQDAHYLRQFCQMVLDDVRALGVGENRV